MISRLVSSKILSYSTQYPVVTITGPRQSGKTTLCKALFPDKPYVSLENLDTRSFAIEDPRGFLAQYGDGAVLDEIQRTPDLLSYIQTIVDEKGQEGMFILTGSQQFDMLSGISQSLAGRTALVKLLPFSFLEVYAEKGDLTLDLLMYRGFYPRIFDKNLNPTEAMAFYSNAYLERDVRNLLNVKDLSRFEVFLKLCAGRTGQVLNLSNLGNDCGVNHNTIKSWISILEASYIIKLLRPYHNNFNKRLTKSPKLYFLDTGLACYLLDIHGPSQLATHPLRGALFETFVVSELLKQRFNSGKEDNLYYFRDHKGNEVDIVLDYGSQASLVEVKSGQTVTKSFFRGLEYFAGLHKNILNSYLIYGGEEKRSQKGVNLTGWNNIASLSL